MTVYGAIQETMECVHVKELIVAIKFPKASFNDLSVFADTLTRKGMSLTTTYGGNGVCYVSMQPEQYNATTYELLLDFYQQGDMTVACNLPAPDINAQEYNNGELQYDTADKCIHINAL